MRPTPLTARSAILAAALAAPGVGAAPDPVPVAGGPGVPAPPVVVPQAAPSAAVPAASLPVTPAPALPGLEGRPWRLAAYGGGSETGLTDLLQGQRPALFRLEEGRIAGTTGCNRIIGAYQVDGATLTFQAKMAATMMACPEPMMKQEQAVGTALATVAGYRLEGDLLEFLDGAGRPLLRFLSFTPAPLVGPAWQLTGYHNGKGGLVSVVGGTEVGLEFREDGTLGGFDGCNRYRSGYTLEDGVLTIGPLASTRMACKGPAGAAQQARDYAAALGTIAGYRIEGGDLTLLNVAGSAVARFQAPAAKSPVGASAATGGAALPPEPKGAAPVAPPSR